LSARAEFESETALADKPPVAPDINQLTTDYGPIAMKPEELKFSKTHEWTHVDPATKTATIGLSAFALEALTDLVFVELPKVGTKVSPGQSFGEIESVKAVSDIYSPVSGEIVASHADLADNLDKLKSDPYGEGWLVKIKLADEAGLGELMSYGDYQKQCAEEQH
jgi:glycine cleavage system H protein